MPFFLLVVKLMMPIANYFSVNFLMTDVEKEGKIPGMPPLGRTDKINTRSRSRTPKDDDDETK